MEDTALNPALLSLLSAMGTREGKHVRGWAGHNTKAKRAERFAKAKARRKTAHRSRMANARNAK